VRMASLVEPPPDAVQSALVVPANEHWTVVGLFSLLYKPLILSFLFFFFFWRGEEK
jgi:hypothetical protein